MKNLYKSLLIFFFSSISFCGFAQLNVNAYNSYGPVCLEGPGYFSTTVTGGVAPYHYQWSPSQWFNNDSIYDPICFCPYNIHHDTSVLFTVVVTDNLGAIGSDTLLVHFIYTGYTIITSTAQNNTICNGMSTTLTASRSVPCSCSFTWYPSETLSSSTGASVVATPTASISYIVTASCYGCTGSSGIYIQVTNCSYNIIHSSVFNDLNNNGTRDAVEYTMPAFMSTVSPAASVLSYFYDTALTAYVGLGSFTVGLLSPSPYYTQTTNPNISFSGYTTDATLNVGLHGTPGITDIKVDITPYYYQNYCEGCATLYTWGWPYSGGGIGSYLVHYTNVGTDTLSGVLKIKYDSQFSDFGATHSTGNTDTTISVVNDTLTWQYHNLLPGEDRYLNAGGQVINPVVGNSLQVSVIGYPLIGDAAPANNYDTCHQLITSSYDPNFKQVNKTEVTKLQITAGTPLTYTIHFQNTGTAMATVVKVRDTLSSKLNAGTLQMISASHPYTLSVTAGNEIEWKFNNINLPDSGTNQLLSNGFLKFSITPVTTLNEGDSVTNKAYIYFDNNAPVKTNRAITNISLLTSTQNTSTGTSRLIISPNPATGIITITLPQQFSAIKTLDIYNSIGQLQLSTDNITGIDVSSFNNGLYFVVITNTNNEKLTTKLIKE